MQAGRLSRSRVGVGRACLDDSIHLSVRPSICRLSLSFATLLAWRRGSGKICGVNMLHLCPLPLGGARAGLGGPSVWGPPWARRRAGLPAPSGLCWPVLPQRLLFGKYVARQPEPCGSAPLPRPCAVIRRATPRKGAAASGLVRGWFCEPGPACPLATGRICPRQVLLTPTEAAKPSLGCVPGPSHSQPSPHSRAKQSGRGVGVRGRRPDFS